jgi:hypothetical protein
MNQITKLRFDALARYIREPQAAFFAEELEWYSEGHDRIVSAESLWYSIYSPLGERSAPWGS